MDSEQALDTAVRLELYRFFIDQGRPPVPAEVAQTLATDQASVEDSHAIPGRDRRSALPWQLHLGRAWGRRDAGRDGNGDHLVSGLP